MMSSYLYMCTYVQYVDVCPYVHSLITYLRLCCICRYACITYTHMSDWFCQSMGVYSSVGRVMAAVHLPMTAGHSQLVCYFSCVQNRARGQPYPLCWSALRECIQKSCDCTCHIQLYVHNVLKVVLCTWLAIYAMVYQSFVPTSIGGCGKIEH